MPSKFISLVAAGLMALSAMPAAADTLIDFQDRANGPRVEGPLTYPGVTFTAESGVFTFITSFNTGATRFCAYGDVFTGCSSDWQADFTAPVQSLSFRVTGFNARLGADSATAEVFGTDGMSLGSREITSDGVLDFGGIDGISRLTLTDRTAGGRGMSYTDFRFDTAGASAVPVPAALPLLAGAVGVIGMVGRRRSKR